MINYPKPFPLLSGFHKEASWDPYRFSHELPAAIQHSEVSSYADDAVLYRFAKEPRELESKLNADLYNVELWLNANRLTLNLSKTKSILIGSNKKLINIFSLSLSILIVS